MSDISRLVLEIDSNGVVKANGNLDLFKKKSDDAAKSAKKFGHDFQDSLVGSVTAGSLAAAAIQKAGQAAIGFFQGALESSGKMEMIKANLETVMGSAELASATFQKLKDFAARTPFEISGISESAIMLKQSGVAAGDLIGTLQMLGDAAGGSQEKLNRIALNYAQIQSLGKAATMDIKQFAMAGLPIYQALAEVTGKNGAALEDMMSSGKITEDVIVEAFKRMTSEGGVFFDGMARGADTLDGKFSTLKDTWNEFLATFSDKTGLSWMVKQAADIMTQGLQTTIDNFNLVSARAAVDSGQGTDDQIILVANERAAASQKKLDELNSRLSRLKDVSGNKGTIAEINKEIFTYTDRLTYWLDALSSAKNRVAALESAERKRVKAEKELADQEAAAASAALKWQDVLKKALSLSEVSTGAKAVSDYTQNVEDSLNGAIAYAQAFGGDISKIYQDQAAATSKAIQALLQSGEYEIDEPTIQKLIELRNKTQRMSDVTKTPQEVLNWQQSGSFGGAAPATSSVYQDQLGDLQKKISLAGMESDARRESLLMEQGLTEEQAKELVQLQKKLELLTAQNKLSVKESDAAANKDWSEYAKYHAANAGMSSIQGTDAGNFANGMMQGGWQQGLINMVIGAFMKIMQGSEGFQRALNLVTEALAPVGELFGSIFDAIKPIMDGLVMGGQVGQSLMEATTLIEGVLPVLKVISIVIYIISYALQYLTSYLDKFVDWLFGGINDGLDDFTNSLYGATEANEAQADVTGKLISQLEKLKDQIRDDELYFSSQRQSENARYQNTLAVNDAIITPSGRVITTAPDDYLIATKTPGALYGGGTNVFVTVTNTAGDVATAVVTQRKNADGSAGIFVAVKKIVESGIASGEFDGALAARDTRLVGRRVSS